ncbi:MAG: N-formylglutamate deformylase [Parvularculaceae bacterium]|nr:N-formylglutamate deformylase [Parvularculaceae bacterium]
MSGADFNPVEVTRGEGPVVLGVPHAGTHAPDAVFDRLNEEGRTLRDADWHVDRLYEGLLPGATIVRANFHRYVIDANRDPSGASLYPGMNTTELVPTTNFDGEPIWKIKPDADEIEARRATYHAAYHAALAAEIERVKAAHGVVILYDCHSIRSRIPHLFDDALPDLNIGTNGGATCDPRIERAVAAIAERSPHSHVVNGRFKGGWTTRRYGRPETGAHAIQMELSQALYLSTETPPFDYDSAKAGALRTVLSDILNTLAALAGELKQ